MLRSGLPPGHGGQIFSIDLVFAMLVFSMLIGSLLLFNSEVYSRTSENYARQEIGEDSQAALAALLLTGGSPSNWSIYDFSAAESAGVHSIGLASAAGEIDPVRLSKLASLNSTNYSSVRAMLGLSKPSYNLILSLKYLNGTEAAVFGIARPYQNITSVLATSYSSLSGEPVLVTLGLWRSPA